MMIILFCAMFRNAPKEGRSSKSADGVTPWFPAWTIRAKHTLGRFRCLRTYEAVLRSGERCQGSHLHTPDVLGLGNC